MKTAKRILKITAVLLLVGVVAIGAHVATAGMDVPDGPESLRLFTEGVYEVGDREVTFVDTIRTTRSNNEFAGFDTRTLVSTVWYPDDGSGGVARDRRPSPGFPLIVYGHGFTSMRSEGAYLARHFASHCYIVVAPDFPLTNIGSPGGPRFDDVVHQPGDMSFLIDELLGWNRDPGHDFSDAVDEDRIGAMGLSLGGMTTTLAAFHPRLRDPRLVTAVSIAGPSAMFTPSFFETADVPFLMIAGDADGIVGYDANAASLLARAPGARLVTLRGGSHAGFAEIARYVFRWVSNPDTLACRALAGALTDAGAGEGLAVAGLGDVNDGVDQSRGDTPCQRPSTERAMRPARQQTLTTLAAFAFFQSQFAVDVATRRHAETYLDTILARENPDASVEASARDRRHH